MSAAPNVGKNVRLLESVSFIYMLSTGHLAGSQVWNQLKLMLVDIVRLAAE